MRIIDLDEIEDKLHGEDGDKFRSRAKDSMVVLERRESFLRRLFGFSESRTIDARIVKSVEGDHEVFKIELLTERDGVIGKRMKSEFLTECFPGGDDYFWWTDREEDAIRRLAEVCIRYKINSPGSTFYVLYMGSMI